MTSTPRPQAPAGLRVGDYTLLTRLGEGGMGVVHLARKPGGDRVALKVLRPHIVGDDEARARLAREVSSLERIRSRWVAEIVDADPWADIPYVATRYVPGLSLHDHVAEEGPITGADLTWFARCLAEGLASVHRVGVLHRDVKPSNVLMEGRTPILIDFGLARVADDPRLTHTGWLLGTPGYLAPEILYGDDATPASDVHSWAATVAYAGTGHAPFGRGPSMAIMDRVRRGEHRLDGLPGHLVGLVSAALDPDPARRPPLAEIRSYLDPHGERTARFEARPPLPPTREPDPFTLPLALAAEAPPASADPFESYREGGFFDDRPGDPLVAPPVAPTHWLPDADQPLVVPGPGAGVRLRRSLLTVALGLVVGAGVAAYPWLAAAVVGLLVWVLRAGSLTASARQDRRAVRGIKWYDVVVAPLSSPWHLLRAAPGALVLLLWSAGLGAAAGLVCYAASTTQPVLLTAGGLVFAGALWVGPGASRLRRPLQRVTTPLSSRIGAWLVVTLVVLAVASALEVAAKAGATWTPFGS